MTRAQFQRLVSRRWEEAERAVGLRHIRVTWDFGEYSHFKKARGYGVTFGDGRPACHLRFAEKVLRAAPERADGVLRHEIGHVLDFVIPAEQLDAWALSRNVRLPHTAERRADAIASAIWNDDIRYDRELLVQTTGPGICPRPRHLGL